MDFYYATVGFSSSSGSTFFVVAVFSSFQSASFLRIGAIKVFYTFSSGFFGKGFYTYSCYSPSSSVSQVYQSYSVSRGIILISLLLYCFYFTVSRFVVVSQCAQVLFCTCNQSISQVSYYTTVLLLASASIMFTTITCYGVFFISAASYFTIFVVTIEFSTDFLSLLSERSFLTSFAPEELDISVVFTVTLSILLSFSFSEAVLSGTAFTISVVLLCDKIYLAFFYYIACLCNFSSLLSNLSFFSRTFTLVSPLLTLVSVTVMVYFGFFKESVAFTFNTFATTVLVISSSIVVVEFNEVELSCFLLICSVGFSSTVAFKIAGYIVGRVSRVGPLKGCGLLLLGIYGSDARIEGTLAVKVEGESEKDYLLIVSAFAEKVKTIRSSNTVCLFIQKLQRKSNELHPSSFQASLNVFKDNPWEVLRTQSIVPVPMYVYPWNLKNHISHRINFIHIYLITSIRFFLIDFIFFELLLTRF